MFMFFGLVLRSVNNMAVSVGGQFPFYSTLRSVGRIAEPTLNIAVGGGAVLIRRKLPYSLFRVQEEEPVPVPSKRRSPLRFIAVAGVLLIFVGIYMGLFDVVALEALVLFVTGLILLPTAFLIRRFSKAKSRASVTRTSSQDQALRDGEEQESKLRLPQNRCGNPRVGSIKPYC